MGVMDGKKRFQVTFSEELSSKVERYCKEAGISKSAYLSLLAAKDLDDTDKFLREFRDEIQGVVERLNKTEN